MLDTEEVIDRKLKLIKHLAEPCLNDELKDKQSIMNFIRRIIEDGMTCDNCRDNDTCKMAYDGYNMDGDCIMMK